MSRFALILVVALFLFGPTALFAWNNDGPPIVITSPQGGTTFARCDIKNHSLIWNKNRKMLVAVVTFTDAQQNTGTPQDDTHYFDLPGVNFDEAKGIFTATAPGGEIIPIAKISKMLFIKSIVVLPNANVRILHPRGDISVVLEAISPNDPAMKAPPKNDSENLDGTHNVDVKSLLN
jgi:hypothetical protein